METNRKLKNEPLLPVIQPQQVVCAFNGYDADKLMSETAKLRKLITKRGTLEILIPLCCTTNPVRHKQFKQTMNSAPLESYNDDTTDILNTLCEREANNDIKTKRLKIINYVPCEWKEDFVSERKGAVSAFSTSNSLGTIEMALLIDEIPYIVSEKQLKENFSMAEIKKVAEEINAISYSKSLLSGLECQEIIFKKDNPSNDPGSVLYSVHYEAIFDNKYITLSYSVSYHDVKETKKIFYRYLPIFKNLSQRFQIRPEKIISVAKDAKLEK